MKELRIAVFADGNVGYQTIEFLQRSYPGHLLAVFLAKESKIRKSIIELGINPALIYSSDVIYEEPTISYLKALHLDYILLAWWPFIIKQPLFSIPKIGILNYHPSFLPYNRGKHYNFWTLVEGTPFGVTIHFVNEKIDSGDIVFQKRIEKSWLDTGESLYWKAQKAILELFIENYPNLISKNYSRVPQDPKDGTFHYAKELEPASQIRLDESYSGKNLLNLIRARVFPPHPSCWFLHNRIKYNVTVQIEQADKNHLPGDCMEISLDSAYIAKDLIPICDKESSEEKCLYFYYNGQLFQANLKVFSEM